MAEQRDGAWTWTHSDHLHSATVITDASGAEIRRLAYAAFGEQAENTGSGDAPKYTYTAKEADQSGLMYYGARYYDPALSRFITADTMYDRGPQGLNRYSYSLNNPIVYRDPTGHAATPAYAWGTPYVVPYVGTIDTGNNAADVAIASVAGVWNLGAYAVNGVVGVEKASQEIVGATYEAVETVYNDTTGGGISHLGLETDIMLGTLTLTGMPIEVAAFKQSLSATRAVAPAMTREFTNAVKKIFSNGAENIDDVAKQVDHVNNGKAIVRRHGKHFSVEVESGGTNLHTHQVVTSSDRSTTQIMTAEEVFPGQVTGSPASVQLSDAQGAMAKQQQLIQQGNLGHYNTITNSCVSHVCDVLNAGGVNTPPVNGSAQSKYLIDLIKEVGSQ